MRIKVPEYFLSFKCIADKCKDSCCIGWEIDVDSEAKAKYENLDTDLGREIVEKTQHGYFPLQKNGRCAFLDKQGLCRIISSVGEGYLCDICREHPRYYGISADGIEGGLGLGCEEAARLILKSGGRAEFSSIEHSPKYFSDDAHAHFTDEVRRVIYEKIATLGIKELIGYLYGLAPEVDGIAFDLCAGNEFASLPEIKKVIFDKDRLSADLSKFTALLSECEALDDDWQINLKKTSAVNTDVVLSHENEIKSLVFYFTHRYVRECTDDMSVGQRILFSLFSSLFIIALSAVLECEEKEVRAAVLFSKNIEYSTDNVDIIIDALTDIL